MKLKQLFCRHKKLTAVGIYEKPEINRFMMNFYGVTANGSKVYIVCKCNRCAKEFEYGVAEMQDLRHEYVKQINIDKIVNHELWGKWW